jgi:hypothetical protein
MKKLGSRIFILAAIVVSVANADAYEFGWPGGDFATAVAELNDGSIAIGGAMSDSVEYRPFVARVLPTGELAWVRKTGGTYNGAIVDLIALEDSSLIAISDNSQGFGFHVAHYDIDGGLLREWNYAHMVPFAAALAEDGDLYIAGRMLHFAAIVRASPNGDRRWTWISFEHSTSWLGDIVVIPDSSGICAVGGASDGQPYLYVVRLDGEGNLLWSSPLSIEANGYGVAVSSSGIIGVSGDIFLYDGTEGYMIGLDPETGEILWGPVISDTGSGFFMAIASSGEEFVAVGMTMQPFAVGILSPSDDEIDIVCWDSDALVMCTSQYGELLDQSLHGSITRNERADDLCATSSGHYIMIGQAYGHSGNNSNTYAEILDVPSKLDSLMAQLTNPE